MKSKNGDPEHQSDRFSDSEWIKTISENSARHSIINHNTPAFVSNSIFTANEGDQLGSGKIVGVLGEGGMGRVYKIWSEDLELFRAVKIVLHNKDVVTVMRFQREAKLTARLDHSNIVRIFGTGIWNGCRYIEMEYIEGASFDVLLKEKKKFSPSICAAIGLIVARVLAYAHSHSYTLDGVVCRGVVHRDLKPSNLMLTTNGKLKVLDFGIARPLSDELITLTTGVVGSLCYLPPEQLDGRTIDYSADIYSLGAILYEFACGQVAFPFTNHREFYENKKRGVYIPLTEMCPDIPIQFSNIVDCCLNPNPKNRFSNASELIEELKDFVSQDEKYSSVYDENTDCLSLDVKVTSNNHSDSKKTTHSRSGYTRSKTRIKKPKLLRVITLVGIAFIVICSILFWRFSGLIWPKALTELDSPVIISPGQGDFFTGDSIYFIWKRSKGASFYELAISQNKDFSGHSLVYSNLRDTVLATVIKGDKRLYYWRVASCRKGLRSLWSDIKVILPSQQGKSVPVPPIPISPVNNQKDVKSPVVLKWKNTSPSVSYSVQIASDYAFKRILNDKIVADTVLVLKDLGFEQTFFWRVGVEGLNSSILWSPVMIFRTKEKASVYYSSSQMIEIALKAITEKRLNDAKNALQKVGKNNPAYTEIVLRLADAYLNMGSIKEAGNVLTGIKNNDALFFICKGRIFFQEKKYTDALKTFKTAQSQSSAVFDYHRIIRDASYYYAEAYHQVFLSNPTIENKDSALKAWEIIITKLYRADKSNPRFKNAIKASNQIVKVPVSE